MYFVVFDVVEDFGFENEEGVVDLIFVELWFFGELVDVFIVEYYVIVVGGWLYGC